MNSTTGQRHPQGWYEIRLQGRLETRWSVWFDGLDLTAGPAGTTVLRGPVVDQAALHGLLQRFRDLGLPLLSVTQVEPDPTTQPDSDDPQDPKPGDQT